MCRCQFQDSCFGCHHATNRRQFVRGSAAAAAAVALGATVGRGDEPNQASPAWRWSFCPSKVRPGPGRDST